VVPLAWFTVSVLCDYGLSAAVIRVASALMPSVLLFLMSASPVLETPGGSLIVAPARPSAKARVETSC
jgi:hypothetical protein